MNLPTHSVESAPSAIVSPEEWQVRVDLAAFYRLAAQYEWTDLIYSHISARVPGPDNHFLLNPFGWMFDEVTASSLVKIDLDGNIVAPTENHIHPAAFVIHSAIYEVRPDIQCIFHAHTRAGMAISTMECGLLPLTQHAMIFHDQVAYHASEGFALDMNERKTLGSDLGQKSVMILRNHGTLMTGHTIPQAFSMMWHLERAMQVQVDALASQRPLTNPPEAVAESIAQMAHSEKSPLGRLEWPALIRHLERTDPSYRT